MSIFLIGDVQGCDAALGRLLSEIAFSPSRDTLYFLGDLVNRGPDSAKVLRRLMGYGASAQCVLGNHDLHLLVVSVGAQTMGRRDTLTGVLDALDRDAMLDWLRHQRMAILRPPYLMVHAGVLPQWTAAQTLALAAEVEAVLHSAHRAEWHGFLHQLYGDTPDHWDATLTGIDRLRVVVNALTRLRFCTDEGQMEFEATGGIHTAPLGYLPWFDVPGRQSRDVCIAFGHWSTLGWQDRSDVIALDTGCVWGGALSAFALDGSLQRGKVFCVTCHHD